MILASIPPIPEASVFSMANIWGWILSSLTCILLTVFFYPYLDNQFQSFIVRMLGFLRISSKHRLSGKWMHIWHVNSDSFLHENIVESVEIKQFRNRVFAQYEVLDKNNKKYTYQMLGRIKNDQTITGTWKDVQSGNRYYGCFQLFVNINEDKLQGYWTGISNQEKIKSGKWEWTRKDI